MDGSQGSYKGGCGGGAPCWQLALTFCCMTPGVNDTPAPLGSSLDIPESLCLPPLAALGCEFQTQGGTGERKSPIGWRPHPGNQSPQMSPQQVPVSPKICLRI